MRKKLTVLFLLLLIMFASFNSSDVFAIDWEEREINDPLKEWTVVFNQELNEETLIKSNIYILDEKQQKIEVEIEFNVDIDKNSVIIRPLKEYIAGDLYTLNVELRI